MRSSTGDRTVSEFQRPAMQAIGKSQNVVLSKEVPVRATSPVVPQPIPPVLAQHVDRVSPLPINPPSQKNSGFHGFIRPYTLF